mmetsp:Transcript_60195/g.160127  ORF Transcript_60195/g.160127 Transcript_60195/m.160127 type:complete len:238 (+) Transcript_60195:503-1216(+)
MLEFRPFPKKGYFGVFERPITRREATHIDAGPNDPFPENAHRRRCISPDPHQRLPGRYGQHVILVAAVEELPLPHARRRAWAALRQPLCDPAAHPAEQVPGAHARGRGVQPLPAGPLPRPLRRHPPPPPLRRCPRRRLAAAQVGPPPRAARGQGGVVRGDPAPLLRRVRCALHPGGFGEIRGASVELPGILCAPPDAQRWTSIADVHHYAKARQVRGGKRARPHHRDSRTASCEIRD